MMVSNLNRDFVFVFKVELEAASKEQKIASSDDKDCFECVTEEDVLSYARQIALGMVRL